MSNNALFSAISKHITQHGGAIPFNDFMNLALYLPDLGYYTSAREKIGRSGDFITAPEVSPLFAECLAVQCQQILASSVHPEIVEIGAGMGTLAADLLLALEQRNRLPDCYHIVEISPSLQAVQRDTLERKAPHLVERVQFHTTPLSTPFNGIILGNEILDALPFTRFTIHQNTVAELGVTLSDNQLIWKPLPASEELEHTVNTLQEQLGPFAEGYTSEILLDLPSWLQRYTQALQQGVVLLIDYGHVQKEYYAPYRSEGTLHCHYQHRVHHNPLIHLGEQDITAYVDFTAVAEAALALNFTLGGYTTQALFLASCGMSEFLQRSIAQHPAQILSLQHQVKRLTHPTLMGDIFKVIALQKNHEQELIGFQFANLQHLL